MAEVIDTIYWGETYEISIAAQDASEASIPLDNTWQAACAISSGRVGGPIVAEPTMTIAAGVATATIDTGEAEWSAGEFYYDIRITNPDGEDFWTDPVKLRILNRNTPAS